MEAEGALKIYLRSEEKWKLRYMPYVGDRDSKSYARVQYAKPYGPAVEIELDALLRVPRLSLYWEALAKKFNQIDVLKLFCFWLHFLESINSLLHVCRS